MMRRRRSLLLGTTGLLLVLGLLTGCYRPVARDVTPTAAGGAATARPGVGTPDLMATAAAMATLAAQTTRGTPTVEPATEPAPTRTASATATVSTPVPTTPSPPPTTVSPSPTPVTTTPTVPAPTPTSPPTDQITHVVQPDENLFRIALRYGTTVEAITNANGIADPASVYVGQVLIIPSSGAHPPPPPAGETTYVVQPGDRLYRIALRFDMSWTVLAEYNGITDPSTIYPGQVLRIPPH